MTDIHAEPFGWRWVALPNPSDPTAVSKYIEAVKAERERKCTMKAIDFLKWLRDQSGLVLHTREGALVASPSNAELRRWLKSKSVLVNGVRLSSEVFVTWPIEQLILFPGTEMQVTIIGEEEPSR